ncbi:MAG: BlaI/MecI/CopY family transcriptional regulator [Terriglobales bacterium]
MAMNREHGRGLSELEQLVMEHVWSRREVTAMDTRDALQHARPMRESTARTIFRRLERKGFVRHEVVGRTYVYRAAQARQSVVMKAVKQVADRFCGGSAERLILGLVESEALSAAQLERLERTIAERKRGGQ